MGEIYKNPLRVYLVLGLLAIWGILAGISLPISLFPNSSKPTITANVNYGDLTADEFYKSYGRQAEAQMKGVLVDGKAVDELKDKPLPADAITKLYKGKQHGHHMRNFFECIKTREQPISDVFSHHRAMTTCHLANICIRLGRPLKWDPATEQMVGDDEANNMLARTMRAPWQV